MRVRRAVLGVDAGAMVEGYLRKQARAGRMNQLAPSRDALSAHCRAQGNGAAVYCLATAPDFSLLATPGGGARLVLRRRFVGAFGSPGRDNLPDNRGQEPYRPASGPACFRALRDDERGALGAQARKAVDQTTARRVTRRFRREVRAAAIQPRESASAAVSNRDSLRDAPASAHPHEAAARPAVILS